MSHAPHVAAFQRRYRNTPGPLMGASLRGVPFLPGLLGPLARLSVEIAWGAQAGGDAAAWPWVDVTSDVRQDPGISMSLGRANEATTSQPATCTLLLDNASGRYSAAPDGLYWPNIRQGVPVRVSVDPDGSGSVVLFQGTAAAWTPAWDLSGAGDVSMSLEAAGRLRQLGQGAPPVQSVMRRTAAGLDSMVSYWPCEDGKAATYFAAGKGLSAMTFSGQPKPASGSEFLCSKPLAAVGTATMTGLVDDYTVEPTENGQQVRALFTFPDTELTDQQVIMRIWTSGTAVARFDIRYNTGGAMDLKGYNSVGALVYDGGAIAYTVKGSSRRISFEMYEAAGVTHFGVNHVIAAGGGSGGSIPGDPNVAGTAGKILRVQIVPVPDNASAGLVFGHVMVQKERTGFSDLRDGLTAYNAETVLDETLPSGVGRLPRLAAENDLSISWTYEPYTDLVPTDVMGPQTVDTLLKLLRDAEAVDGGILYDGVDEGLYYAHRRAIENGVVALTIDAAALQLAPPFGPVADDQRLVNVATVTRTRGAAATYEQTTGPLGTATAGIADASKEVNCWRDASAIQYASLMVARGTVAGYRYPKLVVDLLATPSLAALAVLVRPGTRVQVTNVRDVLPGAPDDDLDLIVEGISHDLSARGWQLQMSCSPFDSWRVGTLSSDTGDASTTLLRAETDGATVGTLADAGAVSLSVATASGPLWTTTADDYPLYLDVGGLRVRATACSGAASPQTFTVDALPFARGAGLAVTLSQAPVLGL